jgi:hypothetical protein
MGFGWAMLTEKLRLPIRRKLELYESREEPMTKDK